VVNISGGIKPEGNARNNEKGPKNRGLVVEPVFRALCRARRSYFFFFGAAFFFVAAFLVALFIDLFSLTSNFATQKNRNVIHI
jgi:hypothetical protein